MPSAERRLAETLASALDRNSFDPAVFAFHLNESVREDSALRRVIVYLITYGAIEHAQGKETQYAYTCRRLNDTLTVYGEAIEQTTD